MSLSQVEKELDELNFDIQSMKTQREVWLSLVKSLPTVIIVTIVAFLTSSAYASADDALGKPVAEVTGVTFLCVLVLWLCALGAVSWSDKKITDKQKTALDLKSENERLKATAQEMFVRYKSSMMPAWITQFKAENIDGEDGLLDFGMITDWSEAITSSRQSDMRHLDSDLVSDMDRLRTLSTTFVIQFNDFATNAIEAVRNLQYNGPKEHEQYEFVQSAIFALYRYSTEMDGDVPQKQVFFRLLEETGRPSFRSQLKSRPFNVGNLGPALASEELRKKASIALKTQNELKELYSKTLVRIRYRYSAET